MRARYSREVRNALSDILGIADRRDILASRYPHGHGD